jgi:hypothetical protein
MKIIGGKLGRWIAVLGALTLTAAMAYGSRAVSITANLVTTCTNCQTDLANPTGPYSLQPDANGGYTNSGGVISQILTNNSVYNLSTMNTLVNGLVASTTRTVGIYFFSPVEGIGGDNLPTCWAGNHDQDQAVNWNLYASNIAFTQMTVGQSYDGFARLDFNVRNAVCDTNIFRFYLKWPGACITRTSATTWTVRSDDCGLATNYGTASLYGQGGKHGQTEYYGDWREPFQITLSNP